MLTVYDKFSLLLKKYFKGERRKLQNNNKTVILFSVE